MMPDQLQIIDVEIRDIRFPTSKGMHGSDAMYTEPDYSAAYIILKTNTDLEGHGLTFTIGRGNEICTQALSSMSHLIIGTKLAAITSDMAGFWRHITGDSQLRWLGPEKGVIHLATGAMVNAVWDLYAKAENKPLWKLLADMSPEALCNCVDFTYLSDAITREEALALLRKQSGTKHQRQALLMDNGYPAYTTSAGWMGYSDEKIVQLCEEATNEGWRHVKMKVGGELDNDMRRARIIRDTIGYDAVLMMDANQKWDVQEAIDNMNVLSQFKPYWIEEPTSPDDILGHKAIKDGIPNSIKIATGEHCQNRVMFKQFIRSGAMDICQIDACRVGGVNEILSILLMAAKYNIPVCPHAGGVGLCEYVQHFSMFDFIALSGTTEGRMIEYVSHLHEHFIDPIRVERGHYLAPTLPGFSIEMKKSTFEEFDYNEGSYWINERSIHDH